MSSFSMIKQALERRIYGEAAWTLYDRLRMFVPNVAGSHRQLVPLTFLAVEQTFPLLHSLIEETRPDRAPVLDAETFCSDPQAQHAANVLKQLFDNYGSDKASTA